MRLSKTDFMLSLAAKAGKTVSGETGVLNAVRSGKAFLCIVTEDASDNTKKKFRDKCSFYEVPFYIYGNREQTAHVIGKDVRSSVAVTDINLANQIILNLEEMSADGEDQDK